VAATAVPKAAFRRLRIFEMSPARVTLQILRETGQFSAYQAGGKERWGDRHHLQVVSISQLLFTETAERSFRKSFGNFFIFRLFCYGKSVLREFRGEQI